MSVAAVRDRADKKRFIDFVYRHYQDDPYWVPPLRTSEWDQFNPQKNPFYQHARMELFLALRGDEVVGRIAAIDDDNHNEAHDDNIAFFGFFEATDAAVARALLERVEGWAKALGRSALRGPANPSMNDGSGFQIDAFDTSPYVMMPYNPPDYPRYMDAAGFAKVKDLYAWYYSDLPERFKRLAERVRKRYEPTVRKVDMKNYDAEVARLKKIYNEAWEQNWGFVKYTDAEFDHLASDLKLIVEPDLAIFLEIDGKLAGIALTLPDINQVLKQISGGRLLPFGIFKLLWALKVRRRAYIDRGRLPILGLMPEFRNKGLELVLIDETVRRGQALGITHGECSWVLEDNDAMNKGIAAAGAEQYKTYRLYQKPL